MKKYRSLIAFLATFCLSALIYYLSGLPLERGANLAFWVLETSLAAIGAAVFAKGAA